MSGRIYPPFSPETIDVDSFLVNSKNIIKTRTGAEILSDIGASSTTHRHDGQTLQHDGVNSNGGPFPFVTTGKVTFSQALVLMDCVNAGADVDAFLVWDYAGNVDYRTGAEVLSDIGASPTTHRHDGETLQHDSVNSNGGAFPFTTTGRVTFNQKITAVDLTLTDFSGGSETITEILDDIINPGILDAISITDLGGINISWTAGELWDHTNSMVIDTNLSGSVGCTDDFKNYVYWDRSGGGTALTLSTTPPNFTDDDVGVSVIYALAGDIWDIDHASILSLREDNISNSLALMFPSVVTSGLVVSAHAGVNAFDVDMTEGIYFLRGHDKHTVSAFDSTATDLIRWYHNGAGDWVYDTNSQIDADNNDTGAGLTGNTNNLYYPSLFMVVDTAVHWIYPTTGYATVAQAIEAGGPPKPTALEDFPSTTCVILRGNAVALPATGTDQWIDVRPIIGGGVSGIVSDHANLGSLPWVGSGHTGTVSTLAGFDGAGVATYYTESQYFRTNGTRDLTGDLTMSANIANIIHSGTTSLSIVSTSGTVIVEGTTFNGGLLTTTGNIAIPDAGYIGSVSDTDAMQIEADGDVVFTQRLGIGISPATDFHIYRASGSVGSHYESGDASQVGNSWKNSVTEWLIQVLANGNFRIYEAGTKLTITHTTGLVTFASGLTMAGGLTNYVATNNANPEMRIGSSDANEAHFQAVYDTGAQTLDYLLISTDSATEGDIIINAASRNVGISNVPFSPNKDLHVYHSTDHCRFQVESGAKGSYCVTRSAARGWDCLFQFFEGATQRWAFGINSVYIDDFVITEDPAGIPRIRIKNSTGIVQIEQTLRIGERAAAAADSVTYGQFWVKNDDPNVPMFTDGDGADHQLAYV